MIAFICCFFLLPSLIIFADVVFIVGLVAFLIVFAAQHRLFTALT